CQHSFDTPYTF
nr:immunoglobulin light chain junction region [Macaca mulatta]MOV80721.1 immunoglobulin light chain junction region [Macaca mulatta]MOV80741.1 immunoglobulin light chain junction region [Macaca mulatta]MOV81463.1 immunoglobulin light chain junction region [Macaca mulatta]MOV82826.1 immunoglobulin light chain junction region [Macaca mulatta]